MGFVEVKFVTEAEVRELPEGSTVFRDFVDRAALEDLERDYVATFEAAYARAVREGDLDLAARIEAKNRSEERRVLVMVPATFEGSVLKL